MPQIIYDILVWINIIAFIIAMVDKWFEGRLSTLFWLSAMGFGGCGSTIGCYFFHHRTKNGDVSVTIFLTVVQFFILWLLERIF